MLLNSLLINSTLAFDTKQTNLLKTLVFLRGLCISRSSQRPIHRRRPLTCVFAALVLFIL